MMLSPHYDTPRDLLRQIAFTRRRLLLILTIVIFATSRQPPSAIFRRLPYAFQEFRGRREFRASFLAFSPLQEKRLLSAFLCFHIPLIFSQQMPPL